MEYLKKRQSGEIKFEPETDPEKIEDMMNLLFLYI